LALELQLALDHGAGADDDLRLALADLHRKPVRRGLVDPDPAGHVRADPDGDIAAYRLDAAGQVDIDQPDRPVHGLDVAADAPARTDEDAAVHRFHAVAHGRALADADAAVDGGQAVGMDVVGGADAAVHGLGILHDGAAFDGDAAVHRVHVAVGPARLGGDAAVDLADVLLRQRRWRARQGEQEQGNGQAGA